MTVAVSEQNATSSPQVQRLETLTVSILDASRPLGIGREAAHTEVRTGRLRAIRIGGKLRVPRTELDAYITRTLEEQKQMPYASNAERSSKPDQILHAALTAIQCAALLALITSYALEMLSLHPLEMLCGTVIVYAQRMVRDARLRDARSRNDRQVMRSRPKSDQQQTD